MTDEQFARMIELLLRISDQLETLIQQGKPPVHELTFDRGTPDHYKFMTRAVASENNPALKYTGNADSVERFGKRTGI